MHRVRGFLLIADISGFTEFIKIHNMRKKPFIGKKLASYWESHAETIIKDLLETIITSFEPIMKLNKIEGDAAFFYLQSSKPKSEALKILHHMKLANEKFKDKLSKLQFVQSCPCDPCQQAQNLSLKIVIHIGEFHITKIRDFIELSGENIILIHRLLKNSIKSHEYWLFTKQASKLFKFKQEYQIEEIKQNIENFGRLKLDFINFSESKRKEVKKSFLNKILTFPKMLKYYNQKA